MKRTTLLACLLAGCFTMAMAQAKKPKLMVVPSDAWCIEHKYTQTFDNQDTKEIVPDYKTALQQDKNLNNVISKINILMADRGFPLQDLQQTLKTMSTTAAEDKLITSKSSGAELAESPLDRLRRQAKADIIIELDWTINTVGPKQSVTYNLRGLDAYTNKQIAGAQGTGAPSFTSEVPVLLEETVVNHMDNFTAQLQAHFDDLLANGREVAIDIRVFDNGAGIDLEREFGGVELSEVIENWVAENAQNHRYNLSDATENYMTFEQVRIPLYRSNNLPMDTNTFTRQLQKFLRNQPYGITSKVINRGLGRCLLVIGEK